MVNLKVLENDLIRVNTTRRLRDDERLRSGRDLRYGEVNKISEMRNDLYIYIYLSLSCLK